MSLYAYIRRLFVGIDPKVIAATKIDDLTKRIVLTDLYPPFRVKIETLIRVCRLKGYDYYAVSGYRSMEEQKKLYAQGRSTPGPIVTKARPGRSGHNFGTALDVCKDSSKDKLGLQPDWNVPSYEVYAREAAALGLDVGYNWVSFKDPPHVELPVKAHGFTWDALITLHNQGGIQKVWETLDHHDWNDLTKCPACKR